MIPGLLELAPGVRSVQVCAELLLLNTVVSCVDMQHGDADSLQPPRVPRREAVRRASGGPLCAGWE